MIIADTNVLSELVRRRPEARVVAWLDSCAEEVGITAVTVGELLAGVEVLPEGRRRSGLARVVAALVDDVFVERTFPFDRAAARAYARVVADRRAAGRPISTPDAQIAATCGALGATLATRNVRDFEGTGIEVVDPWSAGV